LERNLELSLELAAFTLPSPTGCVSLPLIPIALTGFLTVCFTGQRPPISAPPPITTHNMRRHTSVDSSPEESEYVHSDADDTAVSDTDQLVRIPVEVRNRREASACMTRHVPSPMSANRMSTTSISCRRSMKRSTPKRTISLAALRLLIALKDSESSRSFASAMDLSHRSRNALRGTCAGSISPRNPQ
jgi:hypothetical protein